MGQRYLIDSNVIIDYSADRFNEQTSKFLENLFDSDFLISVVTKIEVLGFNDLPSKQKALEDFLHLSTIIPLNDEVALKTIELRKLHKKLKLGDAIIAASAIVHNFILLTRNIADFHKIAGLQVIDLHNFS